MEQDIVCIPSHFGRFASIPEALLIFFREYHINYLNDSFFPLDHLRDLYKKDTQSFSRVKYLLEIFGFNFISKKQNSYFADAINGPTEVIFTDDSQSFSPLEIASLGIMTLCKMIGSTKRASLSGVVLERIPDVNYQAIKNYFQLHEFSLKQTILFESREAPNAKDELKQDYLLQESINGPKQQAINKMAIPNETSSLFLPVFCLNFIGAFLCFTNEVKHVFRDLGYSTIGSLLSFEEKDFQSLVNELTKRDFNTYVIGSLEAVMIRLFLERKQFLEFNHLDKSTFFSRTECEPIQDYVLSYKTYLEPNAPIRFTFDSGVFRFSPVNQQICDYLMLLGVNGLDIATPCCFDYSIDRFKSDQRIDSVLPLLHPEEVLRSLFSDSSESIDSNPFLLDRELLVFDILKDEKHYFSVLNELKPQHLNLLRLREAGQTLEQLGKVIGATRERARQIVAKTNEKILHHEKNIVNKLLSFSPVIPFCVLKRFPGLLSFSQIPNEEDYVADSDLQALYSRSCYLKVSKYKTFFQESRNPIQLEQLNELFIKEDLVFYHWLDSASAEVSYSPLPQYTLKLTPLGSIGHDYLCSKGNRGYDVNADREDAIAFFERRTAGSKILNYRAIQGNILRSDCVLRGKSKYMLASFVTEAQKNLVRTILEGHQWGDYGETGVSLYEAYSDLLRINGIDNGYFLYGIASKFFSDKYTFSTGRAMRIFKGKEKTIETLVREYFAKHGPIVKEKELLSALRLGPTSLEQVNVVTKFDKNTLVLKEWLAIHQSDLKHILKVVDHFIQLHGFCHGQDFLGSEIFYDQDKNGFMRENQISSAPRFAYFFDVIAERYGVTGYFVSHVCDCISRADSKVDSKADMLKNLFAGKVFTRKEAETVLRKYKMTGSIAITDFFSGWALFQDKEHLILASDLRVDEGVLREISALLSHRFSDEMFVLAQQAESRLAVAHFKNPFKGKPIALASALSLLPDTDWVTPKNDLAIPSFRVIELLANVREFGGRPKYSDLIRRFLFSHAPRKFLSAAEAEKILRDNDLIDVKLAPSIFADIFKGYFDGQLLEVPE